MPPRVPSRRKNVVRAAGDHARAVHHMRVDHGSHAQKNSDGPTHRLTLVGHRPECLHFCQYFVESPGGTRTLNCECAHGMRQCRMCGGRLIENLMIRLRSRLERRPSRAAVESSCRFCWFGDWERGAVISIEFQAVERKMHLAERPDCNGDIPPDMVK